MAIIKVFTSLGVKQLECYDNFDDVEYEVPCLESEEVYGASDNSEAPE